MVERDAEDDAGQYTRKANGHTEIDPERITIHFGPEVLGALQRLEQVVRGKEAFDSDMQGLLQRLSSGKAIPIENALTWLTMLGEETTEYLHATGDREPSNALHDVITHLIGQSKEAKPVSVFIDGKLRSR